MAHQFSLSELEFLKREQTKVTAEEYSKNFKESDALTLASKLAKTFSIEERSALISYLKIIPKFRKKYETQELLLCDQLALEQSTSKATASYKADKCKDATSIADFCCGMGGDSYFLAPSIAVHGVDLSPERVTMYQHNMSILHPNYTVTQDDVTTITLEADIVFLDPSRRSKENSRRNWNPEDLVPTIPQIADIVARYSGAMVKMPPATPLELIPFDCAVEYLGEGDECREMLLLTGTLAPQKTVTAVNVLTGDTMSASIDRSIEAPPITTVQNYLYEPYKSVIRAHLIDQLITNLNLTLIDPLIAYCTSKSPVSHSMLKRYRVIDTCPIGTKHVKKMVKKHSIGTLDIKKRGIRVEPAQEIKKIIPKPPKKGSHSHGILFYTLHNNTPIIILAQRDD
ncbi:MAG: class I SAM-dependent methyltransferase [Fibrobacterales bacterium]